jgi:hypothetical protein
MYDPAFACTDSATKFYGDGFVATSLGFKYFGESFVLVSEVARSFKNRVGGLFGFNGHFSAFEVHCAGKYFPVGFYSPKGVEADDDYVGGILNVRHRSRIADFGATIALDGDTETDSMKYKVQLNLEKKIGMMSAKLQARWRFFAGERDYSGSRAFLRFRLFKYLFLDIRLEDKYVYSVDSVSKGLFGALEVGTEFKTLRARVRYGIFDTDDYDSRMYVYETDLPGIIRNRMLYNKGSYGFIYVSVRPVRVLSVSAKYSVMAKEDISDRILGVQLDIRL